MMTPHALLISSDARARKLRNWQTADHYAQGIIGILAVALGIDELWALSCVTGLVYLALVRIDRELAFRHQLAIGGAIRAAREEAAKERRDREVFMSGGGVA